MNPPQAQMSLPQQQRQNGSVIRKVKTPSVQQALPFTPFTSIVPFDPSIIKTPISTTVKAKDVKVPGTTNAQDILNRVDTASERCQKTLRDVQKLLQTDNLSYFKFRKPTVRSQKPGETVTEMPKLSNFAKMVFESVPIEVEYASAEPRSNVPPKPAMTPQSNKLPNGSVAITQPAISNHKAHQQNAQATMDSNQQYPVVAIDANGTSSQVKQDPVVRVRTGVNATVHIDQKAKGQASVQNLMHLLDEVFAAEDSVVAGDDLENHVLSIFRFHGDNDGPPRTLSPAYQARLEIAVQKAASASRLDSIPPVHLKRAQKLCDDIVQLSADSSLQLGSDWTEADIEEWEQRLLIAENSLLACRVLLKIMTAGSADRELQSEDLVRSMLKVMSSIAETGIVAVVETHGEKKNANTSNNKFSTGVDHHDQLLLILRGFTKALRSLGALLAKVQIDEREISSTVYMCKILIFAENAANDRESILGVQTYEGSRRQAMDVLARVFDKYTDQRQYILSEILTSLEKLPATKQSARQFRLADAKPIQLVSALIMQLIQTSATRGGTKIPASLDDQDAESSSEEEDESEDDLARNGTPKKDQSRDLQTLITPLDQATNGSALYVTKTLIHRALNTTKNADEPHRKLLDIFTEDFLNVLGLPEWPSAELLLRSLLRQMVAIVDNKKSGVPARNFALESLSRMGSGILELQSQARSHAQTAAATESVVVAKMSSTLQQAIDGSLVYEEILHLEGPYRVILEYLHGKRYDGAQSHTAISYNLLQWAHETCAACEGSADSETSDHGTKTIQSQIRAMLLDPQWFETNIAYDNVTTAEGRLAALVITISSPFCRAFSRIFNVLLTNMSSEHATVKSKSLRSVITLIETDPSVLDRNTYVVRSILRCTEDSSPLVRDAALGLIARCTELRPHLDGRLYEHIIVHTNDSAVGVRKRALKMLKEIYLRNDAQALRSAIATAIVGRIKDAEETVVDLAKQTIEEIWFQPFYTIAVRNQSDTNIKIAYKSQAALLVQAVESSDEMPDALASSLHELLKDSKSAKDNTAVTKKIIEVLFNGIIDSTDFPEAVTQGMLLQVLAIFAQAGPKLLTASQLELLEPYTRNLMSNEDLTIFRLALMILRHAMPHAVGLKKNFLKELQKALLGTLGRLPTSEFPEVAVCLWVIDGELEDSTEKLVKLVSSALKNIRAMNSTDVTQAATANKLIRLMALAGQFGKACDLEEHLATVKSSVPGAKGNTVAAIIVESVSVFGTPNRPLPIREAALQSICAVCQRWPKQFLRPDVGSLFDALLREHLPALETVFLEGLLGFFSAQESSMPNASDPEAGATGRERLARTYLATDQDGATAVLSQRYLQHILRLALGSTNDTALTATKLVATIVRQGLPHPKECGPSFIALETSPNIAIAQIACAEHRSLHEKHETIIEKEYVRAMEQALLYQQKTIQDGKGWKGQPPTSKLSFFWDVLRGGKAKVRQKFLTNICSKLIFEPSQLDFSGGLPAQTSFTRFMVENLALFDFDRSEDLKLLIDSLGKTFATTGTALAQSIDSEVFNMNVASLESSQAETMQHRPPPTIDSNRLRTLATSAQILLLIAEARSFLVRCWGGQKQFKKDKAKEFSKAPTRTSNAAVLAESFVKRIEHLMQSSTDMASQIATCRAFAEVVSTDNEVEVGSEDDVLDDDRSQLRDTRSPSVIGTPSGRKRKSTSLGAAGPRKRGRPLKTSSFNRLDEDEDEDADGDWE